MPFAAVAKLGQGKSTFRWWLAVGRKSELWRAAGPCR